MLRILIAAALMLLFLETTASAQFTAWKTLVKLAPPVNGIYADTCVAISKNGLSLYFSSNRETQNAGSTNRDLYVSKRASVDDSWGSPVALTVLNTEYFDSCPALSLDEHRLYFASGRTTGSCGGNDIWVSRRHDRRDDYGWLPPVNLGCEKDGYFNTAIDEQTPTFFEDESGKVWLYVSRGRTGFPLSWDIYMSEMKDDDTFGPATPVPGLNSPATDQGITVRRDGLEAIVLSRRGNVPGVSSLDFFASTRASTKDPWPEPVFVPSLGNPALAQGRITLSFDGTELYFTSYRDGNIDIWVARREKIKGRKDSE